MKADTLFSLLPNSAQVTCHRSGRNFDHQALREAIRKRALDLAPLLPDTPRRVVVAMADPIDCLISLFALWETGACAVLVNPDIKENERQNVVAKTGATLWLDDKAIVRLPPSPAHPDDIDDAALILMTSGTTGVPKGVTHGIGGLVARLNENLSAIGSDALQNTLCTLPLFFGHGLIGNALTALYAGQHLRLLPRPQLHELATFGDILDQNGVTFFSSVPSFWKMVLATSAPPKRALQRVHVGSAPLSLALWERVCEWCGTHQVFNTYGMTETANWISGGSYADPDRRDGYVGKPWGGTFRVLRDGALHRSGAGQIAVKSPGQMLGFWRDPEKTDAAMVDDFMLTGDLGCLSADQSLTLIGRTKNEINVAGIKVHAEEVDMLLEGHPEIAEACSFGIPDPIAGERVAAIVRVLNSRLDAQDVIQWCRSNARADAVPGKIEIVDEIPKNDRGKIAREDIKESMIAKWS